MISGLIVKRQTYCKDSQTWRNNNEFARESTVYRIYNDSLAREGSDLQWEAPFVPEMALEGGMGPEGYLPGCPQPRQGTQYKMVGRL